MMTATVLASVLPSARWSRFRRGRESREPGRPPRARDAEPKPRAYLHARDEQGRSQWAVLTDPVGAAFGSVAVVGAESPAADEPASVGRIAWLTMMVADAATACRSYEQVIGWARGPVGAHFALKAAEQRLPLIRVFPGRSPVTPSRPMSLLGVQGDNPVPDP